MANGDAEPLQGGSFEKLDVDSIKTQLGGQLSTYVDLKVNALDAKLGGAMSGLEREVSAKLDGKPNHAWLIAHTLVIIAALVALLAYGGQQFSGGMSATGVVAQQTMERKQREDAVDKKLDTLANEIAAMRKTPQKEPSR
jgi:hypothetical protein